MKPETHCLTNQVVHEHRVGTVLRRKRMLRLLSLGVALVLLALLLLAAGGVQAGASSSLVSAISPQQEPITPIHQAFLPLAASDHPVLRISALYYDSVVAYEPEEAFQLWNVSNHPAGLSGYLVADGSRTVIFPALTLPAGSGLWCTGHAVTFTHTFGHLPDCEYGALDTDPTVPNLTGRPLRFGNSSGQALLFNPAGQPVDALVYEAGDADQAGWQGPAVQPYSPSSAFPSEGQILYRKLNWWNGQPLPDSDSAADWAQDPADPLAGQRVRYPGWDLERFSRSPVSAANGALTVALAPDNLFDVVSQTLASAQQSIRIASYSFEHPALAQLLAAKASSGVSVTLLLEGSPVGGINDAGRHAAQRIEAAGGQIWFMVRDRNNANHDRYTYQHAKYAIVDERLLLVSSENFVPDSMPDDDKSDGTLGRRGSALMVDDPTLVAHALDLFAADLDPAHHADLFRWTASDPKYGAPPDGYTPPCCSGGSDYQLVQAAPLIASGVFTAQFVQAPETSLLPPDQGGLLGMVEQAGPGDQVLVQQLYERAHWSRSVDTPDSAPNLRLAAYIAAARRGARVRVLLDSFFDHGDNIETVDYLNQLAFSQGLDLVAMRGNPSLGGIHNKMVLVEAGGQGWVHLGSLNGSEASAKVNRELALQVQSDAVYDYLATAFWQDWLAVGGSNTPVE